MEALAHSATRSATSTPATTTSPRDSYDAKWGIDFGEVGQAQVLGKLRKLLGRELDDGFERSLEIGAGTGYFSLNLLQAGVVREATCTDISPGMVSDAERERRAARARPCKSRARRRRVAAVRRPRASTSCSGTRCCTTCRTSTARSPSSTACSQPGGRIVFAGEPSRFGDRLAAIPKRARGGAGARRGARCCAPRRRAGTGRAGLGRTAIDHDLEHVVDIHAFAPGDLVRLARARRVRRRRACAARS